MAFVNASEIERETLRQGDIALGVHLVGSICFKDVSVPSSVVAESTFKHWSVAGELLTGPVIVLSHCCELDRQNGVKLTSIVLAPLRDVAKATAPEKVQEIIATNEITRDTPNFTYLKYFYLPPAGPLPFPRGCVADFSKVFSVRKSSYDIVLSKKVLQLTDSTRESMSMKLSLYFYRMQNAA